MQPKLAEKEKTKITKIRLAIAKKISKVKEFIKQQDFYYKLTFVLSTIAILFWILIVLISGNHLLITKNLDSLRYLLSSAFQGLAALFALIISVAFVVTQFLSFNYSSRLSFWFVRKPWFVSGISLFIIALLSNFLLLSFIEQNTIDNIYFLLVINNILTVTAVLYVIPFVYLFIQGVHPMNVCRELLDRIDKSFFEKINSKERDDFDKTINTLSVVQATIIKNIDNGDDDMARRLVGTLGSIIEENICEENYKAVSSIFFQMFKKVVSSAAQKDEIGVLEEILNLCEDVHSKKNSDNFLKHCNKYDGQSFLQLIIFIVKQSAKHNLSEPYSTAIFGCLSRLREKLIPAIPKDDEISSFRNRKITESVYVDNESIHYQNDRLFDFVKSILIESVVDVGIDAIMQHNEKYSSDIVIFLQNLVYEAKKLDGFHVEAKKDILYSIIFGVQKLSGAAQREKINIFDTIISNFERFLDVVVEIDFDISKYTLQLLLDSMRIIVDDELYNNSPAYALNYIGTFGRGIIARGNSKPSFFINMIFEEFKRLIIIINRKSEFSTNPVLGATKKEIATQLDSLVEWDSKKLKTIDNLLYLKISDYLAENWTVKELEEARK